jgi:hypothetical protein
LKLWAFLERIFGKKVEVTAADIAAQLAENDRGRTQAVSHEPLRRKD